jgi:hypothetical protein
MKTARWLLLALVASGCTHHVAAPTADTQLTIRVVEADTSAPIGFATVVVTTADGREIGTVETALSGWATLTVPRDVSLRIDFVAVGFTRRTEPYRFTQPTVETAVGLTHAITV